MCFFSAAPKGGLIRSDRVSSEISSLLARQRRSSPHRILRRSIFRPENGP
jgi:hypothetical protein